MCGFSMVAGIEIINNLIIIKGYIFINLAAIHFDVFQKSVLHTKKKEAAREHNFIKSWLLGISYKR